MKVNKWIALVVLSLMMLVIMACNISFSNSEENDAEVAVQQTLQALQQTQTAGAREQTAEPTKEQTKEPTITVNPTPCNLSHWTGETIPDGTEMDAGEDFTKSWTLRNDGICDWTTNYKFVFVDGDRLGGAASQELTSVIEPGEAITLKVNLTAPDEDGEYKGVWRMKAANGELFGNYWFDIYVGTPPGSFAVTGVTFSMTNTSIDTICPSDINVKAEITSNTAGEITYYWKDSAGGSSSTKSYTFDEAGKKIVEYNVTADSSGDYWAKLYIDNPNHQWFGPIDFQVNCTP